MKNFINPFRRAIHPFHPFRRAIHPIHPFRRVNELPERRLPLQNRVNENIKSHNYNRNLQN